MSSYATLPRGAMLKPERFTVRMSDDELSQFRELLHLSKLGPRTYESMQTDERFGVTYEWMQEAKQYWEMKFDWRAHEDHINSFPNFIAKIKDDDGEQYSIHFVALFSQKQEAIPIMFTHGWPGSFVEFLGMLSIFKEKYAPEEMPYHLIVPSLPGYAFSSTPPLHKDWFLEDSARLLQKVMHGLGFQTGYAVQGGDIGSYISRILVATDESCKAMHLNFNNMGEPQDFSFKLDADDEEDVKRSQAFAKTGAAYALEQGTRPATIGFVLSSSPLAVLAWIGEKFIAWTDETPSLEHILESITLYWLTESFPRAIWPYRQSFSKGPERYMLHQDPKYYCNKPFGFSSYPSEIYPIPKPWIETTGNLVWFKKHLAGGHFAALEQPQLMVDDIEDFLQQAWK